MFTGAPILLATHSNEQYRAIVSPTRGSFAAITRSALMPQPFNGKIELDIRDSTPDWPAYLPDRAPENAPNVLVVLFDDTGLAAWSPYGGRINMPTLQRLADNGVMYSQWHTT